VAKKRSRKKYISKGQRVNVAGSFQVHDAASKALFKVEAVAKKKRVCFTIPNPDKSCTNARMIRVCA